MASPREAGLALEKKGYPWSRSPWAARGHGMGSPAHLCTALAACGCTSMSPPKSLRESGLNKEIKESELLSYRNEQGKSPGSGSPRP